MGNDKRVRELGAATALNGTHYIPVDQGSGALKRATINEAFAAADASEYVNHGNGYAPTLPRALGNAVMTLP